MSDRAGIRYTCPAPQPKVIELYFLEHRAKLLDIAAFLDRVDRAPPPEESAEESVEKSDAGSAGDGEDYRIAAMKRAIAILMDGKPQRAKRIQELFSDHTTEPIDKAPGKGASGAVPL